MEPTMMTSSTAMRSQYQTQTTGMTAMGTSVMTTNMSTYNQHTLFTKQNVLAVPGFLKVSPDDFEPEKQLAEGGMGSVWFCRLKTNEIRIQAGGRNVCVAKISKVDLTKDQEAMEAFYQEIAIMYQLSNSKNIGKIVGYAESPHVLLMRFYEQGALESFVRKGLPGFPYTVQAVFEIVYGISNGVASMHRRWIAHSDLKPANVLLEIVYGPRGSFLRALLTDFGISKILADKLQVRAFKVANVFGASFLYAPPEVIQAFTNPDATVIGDRRIILPGDLYSLGAIIYELIHRNPPWL